MEVKKETKVGMRQDKCMENKEEVVMGVTVCGLRNNPFPNGVQYEKRRATATEVLEEIIAPRA